VFPRDELFDTSGRSLLLASTRELSAVELREVADGVELRALGLVGYLPLTDEIVLNLTPKFSTANFWHMLSVAEDACERVLPVLRSYERTGEAAPHQLLARGFCFYLRELLRLGLFRTYYGEAKEGYYKPKMHFGRTVSRFLSRGNPVHVASDVVSFSSVVPLNGLLKSACLAFLRILPKNSLWDFERALLFDALNALQFSAALEMRAGDEAHLQELPIWLQAPYGGALNVYAIYLGLNKVGFPYDPQGRTLPSFLFKLDKIFESFVRNTFRTSLRSHKLSVLNGDLPKNYISLFVDTKRFPAKPDIIFARKKSVLALGEVKYKPAIEEGDRYQLIAHALAAKAPVGILISPVLKGDVAGLQYVGLTGGTKFYHYTLDLGATDLAAAGLRMVDDVLPLLLP
jgi:5-methylcytosine-specific restriction endonuclease McrBC regulatory subunit McrC